GDGGCPPEKGGVSPPARWAATSEPTCPPAPVTRIRKGAARNALASQQAGCDGPPAGAGAPAAAPPLAGLAVGAVVVGAGAAAAANWPGPPEPELPWPEAPGGGVTPFQSLPTTSTTSVPRTEG